MLTETKVTSVHVSGEGFGLVPQLLPLLKTPRPLCALPPKLRDSAKLRFLSQGFSQAARRKSKIKQEFSTPSDAMNTCSALITIPCFSEIVSDAIFSPNYFPLLRGLGSRLEPEEAARAGQMGGVGELETSVRMQRTPAPPASRGREKEPISQSTCASTFSPCGHYLLIQRDSVSRSGKAIYNF